MYLRTNHSGVTPVTTITKLVIAVFLDGLIQHLSKSINGIFLNSTWTCCKNCASQVKIKKKMTPIQELCPLILFSQ